jgi:hypothetical protein
MTPRHPPRALRDLTTPARRRGPAVLGPGRAVGCGRGVHAGGRGVSRRGGPPPVTIPFRRVHVRGDDCATTTLLQCDERPDCQRTGRATASRPAAPLGGPAIRIGVARTGHWPGGGAAVAAAAPRTQRGRDVSYVASGRPVRPFGVPNFGVRGTGRLGRCLDRSRAGGTLGGSRRGPSRVGDGADVASRPSGEGCGPWRGVGPFGSGPRSYP